MKNLIILLSLILACTHAAAQNAEEIRTQLRPFLKTNCWTNRKTPPLSRDILIKSLDAARKYYLAQQKKDGNFTYAMDIASGEQADDDNQVRQAGALWGLATLHRDFPTEQTRNALVRGLDFVTRNTRQLKTGENVFIYPGEDTVKTGTIALLCLAIMDTSTDKQLPDNLQQHYKRLLFSYLAYLKTMEMQDGSWARGYIVNIGFRDPAASPYYDGETLLAYTIAAQRLGRKDLRRRAEDALPKLIRKYTVSAWGLDGDHDLTKGFYQWGSMACNQIVSADWTPSKQLAADAAIAMAWWQLFHNQTETKRGNMAYALEGLAAAYHVARLTGRNKEAEIIGPPIRRVLANLTVCQFHGPLMHLNPKFLSLKNPALSAVGGITEHRNSTVVRIDIVQHQVHAILLTLKYLKL